MAVTSISVTYYETTEFGSEPITPEQAAAYEACYEERLDARLREWYPEAEVEVTFRRGVGTDRTYVDADSRQEAEDAELSIADLTGTLFLECLDVALAEAPSVECAYCRRPIDESVAESVPTVSDDEAWDRLATMHRSDCEWIETRAHRLIDIVGRAVTEQRQTASGAHTVFHRSQAGVPEAFTHEGGDWYFEPSDPTAWSGVYSEGYPTIEAAVAAAEAWEQRQEDEADDDPRITAEDR